MKRRKQNVLINVWLGTSALLLYSLRDRLGAISGVKDSVTEGYQIATRRVGRASDALRGRDRFTLTTGATLLVGVGLGVGIGMLVAPASGQKTRADISGKVKGFRDKVRARSSRHEPQGATGTYGE